MGKLPMRNWVAKILALILAFILWIYVMNEQNPPVEATFSVPLEVQNLADPLILQDAPDYIRIKVKGPRSIVAGILTKDIHCYADLKGLGEGQHTVKIKTDLPASLEYVDAMPDKITVTLETYVQRSLPLEIKVNGLPQGALPGKITVQPTTVTVEGPKGIVSQAVKAIAIIDVTGKTTDFSLLVPVTIVDSNGKELTGVFSVPEKVTVNYSFFQPTAKKLINVKPVLTGEPANGFSVKSVSVEPDKLEIIGDSKALELIDSIETKPISLVGLSRDIDQDVKVELRQGLLATKDTVKVRITISNR